MAAEANHDILEGPEGECLRGTCCTEVQFKQFATSRAGGLPIVCYAGAARGDTQYPVHWITNHARQFFTLVAWRRLHSWLGLDPGRMGSLSTAAGASGLARRADGAALRTGHPPPLGQASHTPRRQSGPWSSGGGGSGVSSAVAAAGRLGNVLSWLGCISELGCSNFCEN
jgi:hypothetical protein